MRPQPKCGHLILHKQCKDCDALQASVYRELKQEGFEDIEDGPDGILKSWHSFKFPAVSLERHEAHRKYFDGASALLETHQFGRPVERAIWELHCKGVSHREIETAIAKSDLQKKYKRQAILNLIKKISMKITYD